MRFLGTGLVVALAGACASGGGARTEAPAPESTTSAQVSATAARRQRDVISRDELADPAVSGRNVLEVVRSLRPHFLTVRGGHTLQDTSTARKGVVDQEAGKVHASIDGSKIISIEELAGITAGSVLEIRFLSPSQAMQRFGGAAREGPVILVKTM
jgi:hypothetical protein